MSRKGDCWDNAPVESFFSTLKLELIYRRDRVGRLCRLVRETGQFGDGMVGGAPMVDMTGFLPLLVAIAASLLASPEATLQCVRNGEVVVVQMKDGSEFRCTVTNVEPEALSVLPEGAPTVRRIRADDVDGIRAGDGTLLRFPVSEEWAAEQTKSASRFDRVQASDDAVSASPFHAGIVALAGGDTAASGGTLGMIVTAGGRSGSFVFGYFQSRGSRGHTEYGGDEFDTHRHVYVVRLREMTFGGRYTAFLDGGPEVHVGAGFVLNQEVDLETNDDTGYEHTYSYASPGAYVEGGGAIRLHAFRAGALSRIRFAEAGGGGYEEGPEQPQIGWMIGLTFGFAH